MNLPGFTAETTVDTITLQPHVLGNNAQTLRAAAPAVISSMAPMLGVTTDECLAKGLCAYVDTKGHVTCGPCPGQKKFAALDFAAAGVANSFAGFGRVG